MGEWVSLVLSKTNYTRQSSRLGNHQLKGRRDGLDWGVCYLNLRRERARGHLFYFPRWFRLQWHPFFYMPQVDEQISKMGCKICNQEVHFIHGFSRECLSNCPKKKETQFIKFTNNCIVGILLNSLHLFLLLSLLLLIFQFFQVASWPCFWKESNIGLCTQ